MCCPCGRVASQVLDDIGMRAVDWSDTVPRFFNGSWRAATDGFQVIQPQPRMRMPQGLPALFSHMDEPDSLMAITIRPAVSEDADGIAGTFLETAEYHARLDPERYS